MEENFKTVITSEHKLLDLHLKEVWQYRDLVSLLVKRDFTSMYKQTILGPLWAIIQPVLTTVVFTVIFGNLAGLSTMDVGGSFFLPSFLFYLAGNICWNYFSNAAQTVSHVFIWNRETMGKVYYPRLANPIASTLSRLISFGMTFALLAVFIIFYAIKGGTSIVLGAKLLFIPLLILQLMLLSMGCGIIISALTTKYRDLDMLISFIFQLWQYASPIAYGLELVTEKVHRLYWLYMLNPLTPIITTFRYAVFGFGFFDLGYYLGSCAVTLLVVFVGLILFCRIERTFLDTI